MNVDQKPRLLDQVRQELRLRHYSRRTEESYTGWIRRFIVFHGKRHPLELGAAELDQFLSDLATARNVSASTQMQALCALLFLYRDVLKQKLEWIDLAVRAERPRRLPVVLTRDEVRALLDKMTGVPKTVASVLYGAGLRLMECLELRIKDLDLSRGEIRVRDGKGRKDRVTMLPRTLQEMMPKYMEIVKEIHKRDLAEEPGQFGFRMRSTANIRTRAGSGVGNGCSPHRAGM
jgi:site-specific recombinase XerD